MPRPKPALVNFTITKSRAYLLKLKPTINRQIYLVTSPNFGYVFANFKRTEI